MELICKKNTELTREEVEFLYKIYFNNISPILKVFKRKNMVYGTEKHKEEWINDTLTDETLRCFEFFDNGKFVGFVLGKLKEDENYVREFHITDEYKSDGNTFKTMIKMMIPYSQPNKEFTGRIWRENEDAIVKFTSLGAKLINEKYRIPYDKLVEKLTPKNE